MQEEKLQVFINGVHVGGFDDLSAADQSGELDKIIMKIIKNNPDQVEAVKEKPKLMGWFVGQVMKETNGKANPKLVNEILNNKLKI